MAINFDTKKGVEKLEKYTNNWNQYYKSENFEGMDDFEKKRVFNRPLKKEKDFKRSIGKLVEIKLYKQYNGTKELTGVLEKYDENTVTIMNDDEKHEEITLNKNEISMIRLAFV